MHLARARGAEGIGLCRTEHMFMGEERLAAVRQMIFAETDEEEQEAYDVLLPLQKDDFLGIFDAMDGLPVTVRLLDPPLHEFLPDRVELSTEIARSEAAQEARQQAELSSVLRELSEERRRVACHELGHALVAATIPSADPVQTLAASPAVQTCPTLGAAIAPPRPTRSSGSWGRSSPPGSGRRWATRSGAPRSCGCAASSSAPCRGRIDRDTRVAPPLGSERPGGSQPSSASGLRGVGLLRRGRSDVGGNTSGALFVGVRALGRWLRTSLRDRAGPPGRRRSGIPVAGGPRAPSDHGEPRAHLFRRRAAARYDRRPGRCPPGRHAEGGLHVQRSRSPPHDASPLAAIRLFQDVSGWAPHYTDSGVDKGFEPVCFGPSYVARR